MRNLEWWSTSEPFVRAAWVVGIAAVTITVALILAIGGLRLARQRAEQRRAALAARWRPLLMSALTDSNPPLPVVAARDAATFLLLWNHLHESLRGDAKFGLNRIALRLGMHREARRLLASSATDERLIGAATLGNLADAGAWEVLRPHVLETEGPVGLAAARALFRIDAARAAAKVVPLLGRRLDWSRVRVMNMLRDAGRTAVSDPLAMAIRQVPDAEVLRILEFAPAGERAQIRSAILQRLRTSPAAEVRAACLRQLNDPRDADELRAYLGDAAWFVRASALRQLRRFVAPADIPSLLVLLEDRAWWVRLRAAEALAELPVPEALLAGLSAGARALLDGVRVESKS